MNNKQKKQLKFVKVYDVLFSRIKCGTYKIDEKLPPEIELSKEMGVSRMTLRQALSLLKEDGLIKNIQGKGNYIKDNETINTHSLDKISNPIYKSTTEPINYIEFEFRIEPPTDAISECIGYKSAVTIISDRWYKYNNKAIAYSLSFTPIETISKYNINLNNSNELKQYLEQDIYSQTNNIKTKISYSESGNFAAQKYEISKDNNFILLQEIIHNKLGVIINYNKHYIPLKYFEAIIYSN